MLLGVNFITLDGIVSMPQLGFGFMVVIILCISSAEVGLKNIVFKVGWGKKSANIAAVQGIFLTKFSAIVEKYVLKWFEISASLDINSFSIVNEKLILKQYLAYYYQLLTKSGLQ